MTEPRIFAGQDSFGAQIAWFSFTPAPGNTRPIASYEDFIREVVQARIERVPGVSNSNAYGGRENEVRITFDPYKAAALNIDIPTLAALTGNNNDTSGGFSDVGRRQYTLRYAGKYDLPEFGEMVLDWRGGNPVRLRDIATIEVTMRDANGFLKSNGKDSIAIDAQVEQGVNVLEVMTELKSAIEELNEGPLARAGLEVRQAYDESTYIEDSIAMLRTNLLLGICLAIAILWWFLRRFRATFMVAIAIPVSLLTGFIVMQITGRTLNMISLAGLAFATGMVLDAAIVVLENIVRIREKGTDSEQAALEGSSQVWGGVDGLDRHNRSYLPAYYDSQGRLRPVVCGSGSGVVGSRQRIPGHRGIDYPDRCREVAEGHKAGRPAHGMVGQDDCDHHAIDRQPQNAARTDCWPVHRGNRIDLAAVATSGLFAGRQTRLDICVYRAAAWTKHHHVAK